MMMMFVVFLAVLVVLVTRVMLVMMVLVMRQHPGVPERVPDRQRRRPRHGARDDDAMPSAMTFASSLLLARRGVGRALLARRQERFALALLPLERVVASTGKAHHGVARARRARARRARGAIVVARSRRARVETRATRASMWRGRGRRTLNRRCARDAAHLQSSARMLAPATRGVAHRSVAVRSSSSSPSSSSSLEEVRRRAAAALARGRRLTQRRTELEAALQRERSNEALREEYARDIARVDASVDRVIERVEALRDLARELERRGDER
jgi:hypothetical protein